MTASQLTPTFLTQVANQILNISFTIPPPSPISSSSSSSSSSSFFTEDGSFQTTPSSRSYDLKEIEEIEEKEEEQDELSSHFTTPPTKQQQQKQKLAQLEGKKRVLMVVGEGFETLTLFPILLALRLISFSKLCH